MKEPLRWLDDDRTPASLREVLKAAPSAPPLPPELHARVMAQAVELAAAGALAKASAGTGWAAHGLAGLGGAKAKLIMAVSVVGVAGTTAYLTLDARSPGDPTRTVTDLPAMASTPPGLSARAPGPPSTSPGMTEQPGPALSVTPRSLSANASSRPLEPDPASSTPPVAAFEEPGLADEARLLESARSALASNPAQALDLAAQHQRFYPAGQLSAEREFIAIDALLRLGRRDEAERRAAPRLAQAPGSLYARRLRRLLGWEAP